MQEVIMIDFPVVEEDVMAEVIGANVTVAVVRVQTMPHQTNTSGMM